MNLSLEDAHLYFHLMWGLQHYVNQHSGTLKTSTPQRNMQIAYREKAQSRETLWKSPGLIDDYLKENPGALSPSTWELLVVGRIHQGRIFILRHLKNIRSLSVTRSSLCCAGFD